VLLDDQSPEGIFVAVAAVAVGSPAAVVVSEKQIASSLENIGLEPWRKLPVHGVQL
jgi:hypothetical protein